jgi:hypothetical protein
MVGTTRPSHIPHILLTHSPQSVTLHTTHGDLKVRFIAYAFFRTYPLTQIEIFCEAVPKTSQVLISIRLVLLECLTSP